MAKALSGARWQKSPRRASERKNDNEGGQWRISSDDLDPDRSQGLCHSGTPGRRAARTTEKRNSKISFATGPLTEHYPCEE